MGEENILLISLKDWAFYVQLLVCSFSIVALLGNFNERNKNIKRLLLHFLFVFLACLASDLLCSELSLFIPFLRGINFTLSYIAVIIVYAIFISKQSLNAKVVMSSVSFTLICTIIELSNQTMQYFTGNENVPAALFKALGYILIVLFTIVASKLSLNKYNNIPKMSFFLIVIEAVFINGFIFYREKTQLGQGLTGTQFPGQKIN